MRCWYLSHLRATEARTSLRIFADSPEPSLLVYTKIKIDKHFNMFIVAPIVGALCLVLVLLCSTLCPF